MRICILSKFIPPASTDGIPRTRWEYARQFAALGHEVHIITSGFKGTERIEQGIHIHEISAWDQRVFNGMFASSVSDETCRHLLCYSYLVYDRLKKLNDLFPIDIIDSPLWDIEGYISKLMLPSIPMVVRLETTSMLLREILKETKPYKDMLNELETHFMQLASGFVFDSWSILKETERLYKFNFGRQPYCVIHHGIDSGSFDVGSDDCHESNETLKVLIAGRLEKRKGSDILIKHVLPDIFNSKQDVEFHIVGKDSAEWDGFKQKEGRTYHEYIRENFKKYIDKKIFLYGYVPDESLDRLYAESDIVLALSKYESFGLLYLEAMRKGKPLIVLGTGAVPEIFENGKDAIVIEPHEPEKIAHAIQELKDNPSKRRELASHAFQKLKRDFSAEEMGKKCAKFFEQLVFTRAEERTFQVMNCLTDGDGVSNTTVDYDSLLKNNGVNTQIIGTWATPAVQHLSIPIDDVKFQENDYVVYHYWNFCEKAEFFNQLDDCRKIFFFHNITTPHFFAKDDESYYATSKGFEQLSMFDNFDIYVCHTQFSADILRQAIHKPIDTFILPPVIDKQGVLARPYDHNHVERKHNFNLLFVGSIAPHKRQTDLVRFFNYYVKKYDPSARLNLVGGGSPKYIAELETLVKSLKLTDNVLITGKIPEEQLYAFYRTADVFLSMSEHEGFGVPLAEAMCFEIPVVAYRSTAVPDTIGENGCIFDEKNFESVASLVEKTKNAEFRNDVIQRQNRQLENFSREAIFNSFTKLKELAHASYKRRSPKKAPRMPVDQVVMFDDDRFIKKGTVKVTEDHLLMIDGNKGQSSITFEESFQDIQFLFVSSPWSGKVKVCIDTDLEQEFDLYSPHREMKKITLMDSFKPGKHKVTVSTTAEKNRQSMGNEIFLEHLILKKPPVLEVLIDGFTAGSTSVSRNDRSDDLLENSVEGDSTGPGNRILTLTKEVPALDRGITYYNEWLIRDVSFRFTNGKTSQNYFEFTGSFSMLELVCISHEWSGKVLVEVDETYSEVINLYSPKHHEKKYRVNKIFPLAEHHVTVRAIEQKDDHSQGFEVFFKGLYLHKKLPLLLTTSN
jgi:glycosyltransferase involved in cell wall biosynthesis